MPGNFIRVRCAECGNEQVIFSKVASDVACASCGEPIATPTGGHATLTAEVVETIAAR